MLLEKVKTQGLYNFTVKNKIRPPTRRTPQTTETAMTMTVVEKVLFGSVSGGGGATVTFGLGSRAVWNSAMADLFQSIPPSVPFSSLQKISLSHYSSTRCPL